jgi:hypothetical protein
LFPTLSGVVGPAGIVVTKSTPVRSAAGSS